MAYGLIPAALELLDADAISFINKDGEIHLDERPTLFIEFTGSNQTSLAKDLNVTEEISNNHHCTGFQIGVGRGPYLELKIRPIIWSALLC